MIKNKKTTIILTSLITLTPIIAGLLLWQKLPERMPIHWNAAGEVDGYAGKCMAVFALPVFMFLIHILCTFATYADPKNKNINEKIFSIVLWSCPFISVLASFFTYAHSLGMKPKVNVIIPFAMGILFVLIGNYLPKCKQNYTMGLKVPWTLGSEENWNKTHRFAGTLWVFGGLVICASSFIGSFLIFICITMLIVILPIVYSYIYYRRHEK